MMTQAVTGRMKPTVISVQSNSNEYHAKRTVLSAAEKNISSAATIA